jgi:hypothetical protein
VKTKESGPVEKRGRREKKRVGCGLEKEREGEEGCWAGPRGEGERGFGKFSFFFLNLFKLTFQTFEIELFSKTLQDFQNIFKCF